MTPLAGRLLGRYRLDESLGRGGMAEVWRAVDTQLGREVAVKVVLPELAAEPELRQRFLREARLAAALDHPNVLAVYDFGEHDGTPYLVMPLIAGGTLAERLAQSSAAQPLAVEQVIAWVGQIGAALDAAHAAGVLHRDVKPGNVLIDSHGRALLADFGIAKVYAATTQLTRTGMVVGTPTYMAPEVAAGGKAEAASDRYALAVITYEMLAGRPPFEGENPLSILHQHAVAPVPPLSGRVAHFPRAVDRVLDTAMAKKPERRPPSCRRFVETLAVELGVPGALPASAPAVRPISEHARTLPMPTRRPAPRRASRAAIWGGVAVVALAVVGIWIGSRSSAPEPVSTAAAPPLAASPTVEPTLPPPPVEVAPPPPVEVGVPPPVEVAVPPPAVASPPPAVASPPPAVARPARPGAGFDIQNPQRGFLEVYSLERRATAEDFRRVAMAVESAGARFPQALIGPLSWFAAGGLAYVEGRRDQAESELRRLLAAPPPAQSLAPGPWLLLRRDRQLAPDFEDWQLALGFIDPLGEAGAAVERRLAASPADPRLHLARAAVARLDDDRDRLVVEAETAWNGLAGESELRGWAALLAAEGYAARGDAAAMLEWGQKAIENGGPYRGMTAFRLAHLAQGLGRDDAAGRFRQAACQAGMRLACEGTPPRPGRRLRPGGAGGGRFVVCSICFAKP